MDWRRLLDPYGHEAPSSPSPSAATRRRARAQPDLPQPGESFADYNRRTNGGELRQWNADRGMPTTERQRWEAQARRTIRETGAMRIGGFNAFRGRYVLRQDTEAEAEQRARERAAAGPADPNVVFGEGLVDAYNAPTMRALDIPLGSSARFPSAIEPEGRGRARGYATDREGRPTGELRLGLITWGADGRRDFTSIIRDVEAMTGAPDGLLVAIGHRESVGDPLERLQRNPNSSASGPFQFTTGTWRTWMELGGSTYGVPTTMSRDEKDWLIDDPRMSGALAAELARANYNDIRVATGNRRAVTFGDIYMVHFGGGGSLNLLGDRARGTYKHRTAAEYYTQDQVASNPREFFDNGRPRAPEEFYRFMTVAHMDRPERVATFRPRVDGSEDDLRVRAQR